MDNNEIKKANRKAMPKFILIMFLSILGGGVVGFLSAMLGLEGLAGVLKNGAEFFAVYIAQWAMLGLAILLPVVCVPLYTKSRKLLSKWDGENEEITDAIDQKLTLVLWISNACLIVSYFLIAAAYSCEFDALRKAEKYSFIITIVAFFAILVEAIVFQQKCVDTTKLTNPEKNGSVYDTNFKKKWMDSCDEAEKIVIGKCSFKAYNVTNMACTILAIALAVCALIFEIGFLPSFVVCLIWIINLSAYCLESLKYSKAGNKIS